MAQFEKLNTMGSVRNYYPIIIVGGGNSAGYCALELSKIGVEKKQVAIFSQEDVPPYERPALSKAYLHPPGAKQARLPGFYTAVGTGQENMDAGWYKKHGIKLYLNAKVAQIDTSKKTIRVYYEGKNQRKKYTYGKLVLATGTRAITPSEAGIKNAELKNIFTLRTEKQAAEIVANLQQLYDDHKESEKSNAIRKQPTLDSVSSSSTFSNEYLRSELPNMKKQKKHAKLRQVKTSRGHNQSSQLRYNLQEQLNVMSSRRNAIFQKLHDFYLRHEPSKLKNYELMSSLISFIDNDGFVEFRDSLEAKYNDTIDKPLPGIFGNSTIDPNMTKRNEIYAKLHFFYSKNDPSKISKLEIAVEVIVNKGIDEFNKRLLEKYGEHLNSQLTEQIGNIVSANGKVQNVATSSYASIAMQRNNSMEDMRRTKNFDKDVQNYNKQVENAELKPLVSIDEEMVQILRKLYFFYEKFNPSLIINIHKIILFVLENGIDTFNELVAEKYGSSILHSFPADVDVTDLDSYPAHTKKRIIVEAICRYYQKVDISRFTKLNDTASFIFYNGINQLNVKLLDKYGDTIKQEEDDLVSQDDYLYNKLVRYYQVHDQTKLSKLEDIVTFILLNGIEEFNTMLFNKYGSPLNVDTGDMQYKIRITKALNDYYAQVDPSKLSNIESLLSFAVAEGVESLNDLLLEKYNVPLDYEKYLNDDNEDVMVNLQGSPVASVPYTKKPHIVVIGGGYIGIETASALSGWGMDVTLVISNKLAMSKLFTIKMASWFERYFEENHSINIIKEVKVTEFVSEPDDIIKVILNNGEELSCNMVVCGIGSKPNVELCKGQINMLPDTNLGGVITNEHLLTSNEDVFAMGDIAAFPTGDYLERHEHVDNCRKSAYTVAHNLMNPDNMLRYVYFPYFYSRMFEYTDKPVMFRFYGERDASTSNKVDIIQFGDFNSSRLGMFGAFWVDAANNVVIGGILCNASSDQFYTKLRDIVMSRPTLEGRNEEAVMALFNQEMIIDLI